MSQLAYIERTDGYNTLAEGVDDVRVEENVLAVYAEGAVTFFAPGVWASVHTVLSDSEEAGALRATFRARPLQVVPSTA